jgi:uncharacterized protein (TIGR02001 family)
MQNKLLAAIMCACFAMPVLAAETHEAAPVSPYSLTSNVGLVSNYLYRGISQSGKKPAIQGGFDYARTSGLYVGVWGSSISWLTDNAAATGATSSQVEVDTYFGLKNSFATDYSYDVGFLRYNYPANYAAILPAGAAKADTNEIYGLIGWKWLTAKYSYSLGDTFGTANAKGTDYIDVSANYPVSDTGVTLGAHYGKQNFKGNNNSGLTYSDYKLSVSKEFSGYALGLAYSSTNANKALYSPLNKFLGDSTTVLSLGRTF